MLNFSVGQQTICYKGELLDKKLSYLNLPRVSPAHMKSAISKHMPHGLICFLKKKSLDNVHVVLLLLRRHMNNTAVDNDPSKTDPFTVAFEVTSKMFTLFLK